MITTTLGLHRFNLLSLPAQEDIKLLAREFAINYGYQWEFEYYWINFNEEDWLLANIKFPIAQILKVTDGQTP